MSPSKRSSDSTPPPPKRPLYEARGPYHDQLSLIPSTSLHLLKQNLLSNLNADMEEANRIRAIYRSTTSQLVQFDGKQQRRLVSEEEFKQNVSFHKEVFYSIVRKAVEEDASEEDLRTLLAHDIFWVVLSQPRCGSSSLVEVDEGIASKESHTKAVEHSWTADFIGQRLLMALKRHIQDVMIKGEAYARYCSIIQSSGMGKSRLLDEFAKEHFLIPINLRMNQSGGFPPPDNAVRDFLSTPEAEHSAPDAQARSFSRACYFLKALFCHTAATLDTFVKPDRASSEDLILVRAQQFRAYMSEGQTMESSGPNRTQFYKDVVDIAVEGVASGDLGKYDLIRAFSELHGRLHHEGSSITCCSEGSSVFPSVFVMFDEAHLLTTRFHRDSAQCDFVELRRALRELSDHLLFTFFLSTTGKISQFNPPRGRDASTHMNDGELKTPSPFIYLGFDHLMENCKIFDKYKTLDDFTSLECIAHMGRPLWGTIYDHGDEGVQRGLLYFALQKLLCAAPGDALSNPQMYAILSQRLALDVNSTIYVPLHGEQMTREHDQISNHMRVCVSIGSGIETIRGIAASEPMLSEAASLIMRQTHKFQLADALIQVLNGFSIHPGDRAELLVCAFFTWARDKTVSGQPPYFPGQLSRHFPVKALFSCLFSRSAFVSMSDTMPSLYHTKGNQEPFGKVFGDALMHFNHFIKPQEQKLLARPYFPLFMARGAAVLGANCQPGIDAVYPFLYGKSNTNVDTQKIGFIIVQVKKNDVGRESRTQAEVFRKMDPFKCGLLEESDKVDGKFPIPLIRIVFALCTSSSKSGLHHKTYSTASEGASSLNADGLSCFTSYDFWCSGVSGEVLQPVKETPDRWGALVADVDPWRVFYGIAIPELLRSQLPACSSESSHFDSWASCFPGSK